MKDKKILSAVLVLALLMVLGLGIPAWATEGTVIDAATAEDAQKALDEATDNTIIRLKSGVDYGMLYFRQNESSAVVDITYAGGDAPGNEKFRKIEGITIMGNGAVVDGFAFAVGWIDGSGASFIDIKDLVIDGVVFSGEKTGVNLEGSVGSHLGINGLTIKNCKMVDADHKDRLLFQQCTGYKDLYDKTTTEYVMTTGVKNVTITGCETDGLYMVTETRAMENLVITNNLFKNTTARDMLITADTTNYPGVAYTGEITITGNTSDGGKDRFVRMSGSGDAKVTISGNTIKNYLGEDEDYIKVTDANQEKVTIENNNFVYAAMIGDKGYYTLHNAIKDAKDGDTIIVSSGTHILPDLSHDHFYANGDKSPKNLTIQGGEGVVLNALHFNTNPFPENLTVKDIVFDGSLATITNGIISHTAVVGLKVENCSFVNGAYISLADQLAENIEIKNCTFDGAKNPIYIQKMDGLSITGCTIKNSGYNGMQLSSTLSGKITITGNIIENTANRALRLAGIQADAVVIIKENKFVGDVCDDAGEILKISSVQPGAKVTVADIPKDAIVNIGDEIFFVGDAFDMAVNAETKVIGGKFTDDVSKYAANGYVTVDVDGLYVVHKHELDFVKSADATCEEEGYKAHYKCNICSKLFTDENAKKETTLQDVTIEVAKHKIVHVEDKDKTCTEDGIREHWYCEVCSGDQVSMNEELTKMVDYKEVVIPAGHRLMPVEAKAPTYTEPGNIAHYLCTMCDKKYADAETTKELTDVVLPQLIKVEEEKAEVSTGAVDNAIADAKEKAEESGKPVEVVIEVPKAPVVENPGTGETTEPVQEVVKVELPVASLESVAQEEATLTVVLPSVTVTVDTEALKAVTEQAAGNTVVLSVEQIKAENLTEKQQEAVKKYDVAVTIKAEFICQETQEKIWTEDGNADKATGSVTVKMPFTPAEGTKGTDYRVLYIADDGTVKEIETAFENGHLVFALEHFSEYVVVNAAIKDNPATIDSTMIAPFMLLFGLSFAGMAVMVAGKKQIV